MSVVIVAIRVLTLVEIAVLVLVAVAKDAVIAAETSWAVLVT